MLYGNLNGDRISALPDAVAHCPACGEELVPKCGAINVWHWAHKSLVDCDTWFESESKWHLDWKTKVPAHCCELMIGDHRADVLGKDGLVVELQHSTISPEEVRERENHYQYMIWLFDLTDCAHNIDLRRRDGYLSFRWRWPRKHIWYAEKPVFLDLGTPPRHLWEEEGQILQVKKIYPEVPCGGWGYALSYRDFIDRYLSNAEAIRVLRATL